MSEYKSIICYNLNNLYNIIKIIEIKNAHEEDIRNFRHYFDEHNKRDLILSISAENSNLKVWNIYNFECLINIKKIYGNGELYSSCFINHNNKIYILTSNFSYNNNRIKIFDLNGKKIEEIEQSGDMTYFIDSS